MKETVIRFLGKDLKIKSVCDDFVRLEYSEEFRAPGEFSCTLSLARTSRQSANTRSSARARYM